MSRKNESRNRQLALNVASRRRRRLLWGGVAALSLGLSAFSFWLAHRAGPAEKPDQTMPVSREAARYVGSGACVSCHSDQAAAWRTSQHHDAMAEATEEKVLGNFNDAAFTYASTTSTFSKRDGRFRVRTEGPDGALADFDVKYTFGVYPLQQYLIEFPDGRATGALDCVGCASEERGRPALVSPVPDRTHHARRRAALDASIAELELHVRRLPLDRPAEKLRARA